MKRILGVLVLLGLLAAGMIPAAAAGRPKTGIEQRGGECWTTHKEELAFLKAGDAQSERARVMRIGSTDEGRPLHLVALGAPVPSGAGVARERPTSLFICSQHGNEPAGREACLRWL